MKDEKKDIWEKILIATLILCGLIITYIIIFGIIFFRDTDLKECLYIRSDWEIVYYSLWDEYDEGLGMLSNDEYRNLLEDEIGIHVYFYNYTNLPEEYAGKSYTVIRYMLIDKDVWGEKYATVFTHEAFHIKKCTGNERFVCFETFKLLYNSSNKYLHNAGVMYAILQLEYSYTGEYLCEDLIINYLKT